jgi:hypothetical protein
MKFKITRRRRRLSQQTILIIPDIADLNVLELDNKGCHQNLLDLENYPLTNQNSEAVELHYVRSEDNHKLAGEKLPTRIEKT